MDNSSENTLSNELIEKLEGYERKIYDLKNLINLGISLASNLEFESLVESILYSCIGQVFVEKVAILLQIDIDINNFYIHMVKGYDGSVDEGTIVLHDNSPLIHFLSENPVSHLFDDIKNMKEFENEIKDISSLDPHIIVPMKSKNSLNGILILGNKITGDKFSENEKEFLSDLTKFAAIAVENSRLYLMATLDRMTRLYIHHYFQERLGEEIKRISRKESSLSLIMSDIDHFKNFNDTYGHQQGDLVLKECARLFREQIRSVDIPARYGGEEFAVILPDTGLEDAKAIAERLRKTIENHPFPGQKENLHVTISLGVVQYDESVDNNKESLIKRCDMAMYKAKEGGRNQVVAL